MSTASEARRIVEHWTASGHPVDVVVFAADGDLATRVIGWLSQSEERVAVHTKDSCFVFLHSGVFEAAEQLCIEQSADRTRVIFGCSEYEMWISDYAEGEIIGHA